MFIYNHRVKYYETDKMGFTHHSNYIRMMEEARIDLMDKLGISYRKCEEMGIISPVLAVNCRYKKNTTFDDDIEIEVKLVKYDGIKLNFEYVMKVADKIVLVGSSEHCFLNKDGVPARIKRDYPEINAIFEKCVEQ